MIKLPKMPSLKLNNRRALITGAYGGLGLGCSAVLADAGAHVVVSGPNEKKLKSLVETIKKNGGSAEYLVLDISNVKDCLLYTSPSPRDLSTSRMPSSA